MKGFLALICLLLASGSAPPAINSAASTPSMAKAALLHALLNDSFHNAQITDDAVFTDTGDGLEMSCTIQCIRFGEAVAAAATAQFTKSKDGLHLTSYRMSAANPFSAIN